MTINARSLAILSTLVLPTALAAQSAFVGPNQTLSGDPDGFQVSGFGVVINRGTIEGAFNGVEFVNGSGRGLLLNLPFGRVTSDSRAVNIGGRVTMINRGQMLGTGDQRNGTVYSDSVADRFQINNRGIIDAGAGNQGSGVGLEIGSFNRATVINRGLIQGRTNTPGVPGNVGASADGLRLANFGPLADGEVRRFVGNVFNDGQIRSESQSGPIAGFRVGDGVGFRGRLRNFGNGEISGARNGVYFGDANHDGGSFINGRNAVVSSGSRALNIDGQGLEIRNFGTIAGSDNQRNGTVYGDSTAQDFTLWNFRHAIIDAGEGNEGAGFSIELSAEGNEFAIDNRGDLLGRGNAGAGAPGAGDGIRLERTRVGGALEGSTTGLFTGLIRNRGTISSEGANGTVGGFRAVNGVSFQGELSNYGLIAGPQNGVYFGNPTPAGGGDHTGGVVKNSRNATISSDSRAFNLDGIGLEVNNDGDILATARQRNGTFYVDGTADAYVLENSGTISAEGGAGSGLSIQVGSFDGDVQSAAISNSGSMIGSGDLEVDAGVRLFTNAAGGAVFLGNIVNESHGVIRGGDESVGVLVQDGVTFDGAVINKGEIRGGIEMASGDLVLTNSSEVVLEVGGLNAGEFDVISAAGGNITLNGTLRIVFVDGFSASASAFSNAFGASFLTSAGGVVLGSFDRIIVGNTVLN